MSHRLQIVHEPSGVWSLRGLPGDPVVQLDSLAASIDFAQRKCGAAPATIELMVDGFYLVVQQECGWPCRLVAPEHKEIFAESPQRPAPRGASGLRDWIRKWGKRA